VIGNNCSVEPGTLLSYEVKIADGVTVSEGRRITKASREEDGGLPANDPDVVGEGGEGHEYFHEEDEDEDDTASNASSGLGTPLPLHFSGPSPSPLLNGCRVLISL
jgi:translation initiation factor eIF-2B subunit epsilon